MEAFASIGLLAPSFHMALNAQVISGFKGHHPGFVACSAALVTAQTFHRKIPIALVNCFFSNRMRRMGLPFVAFAAQVGGNIFLGYE